MIIVINKDCEQFKNLTYPNVLDRYQISNYGNIFDKKTGKMKKASVNSKGYILCKLNMKTGGRKTVSVHRLVAFEFVEGYELGKIVNHLDSNIENNYYENLEWTTSSGNNLHKYKHGNGNSMPPIYLGSLHPRNVYDEKKVHEICKLLDNGKSYIDIMKHYGYAGQKDNKKLYGLIYDIKNGRVWIHISSQYNFGRLYQKKVQRPSESYL